MHLAACCSLRSLQFRGAPYSHRSGPPQQIHSPWLQAAEASRRRSRHHSACSAIDRPRHTIAATLTVILGISAGSLLLALPALAANGNLTNLHRQEVSFLASNEDFWNNLTQYVRFFISVLAGTAYVAFKPVAGLLKRPRSAIFVILFTVGFVYFIRATLTAMLGTADPIDPFAP